MVGMVLAVVVVVVVLVMALVMAAREALEAAGQAEEAVRGELVACHSASATSVKLR